MIVDIIFIGIIWKININKGSKKNYILVLFCFVLFAHVELANTMQVCGILSLWDFKSGILSLWDFKSGILSLWDFKSGILSLCDFKSVGF